MDNSEIVAGDGGLLSFDTSTYILSNDNYVVTCGILVTNTIAFIGYGSFIIPSGITSISLQGIGGGGNSGLVDGTNAYAAGGGGGGAYAQSNVQVTPGQTIYYYNNRCVCT